MTVSFPMLGEFSALVSSIKKTKNLLLLYVGVTEISVFCFSVSLYLLSQNIPTWVQSLGWEDPLEKQMATHSSILVWKIPGTEDPGRLQSMGFQRDGHNWKTSLSFFLKSSWSPNSLLWSLSLKFSSLSSFFSSSPSSGMMGRTQLGKRSWAVVLKLSSEKFHTYDSQRLGYSTCSFQPWGIGPTS